jgi:dihydropteroate synthase
MGVELLCGRFELTFERPLTMGIVNVTPDSFSDGSLYFDADAAIAHGRELIAEGADMLDIGGESTRPGAPPVPAGEELQRILPVVEALRITGVPISVDTSKPEVMRRALAAGADMINDVYGFRQPGALEAVADTDCGLCAMHMQGEPRTMQLAPHYQDLLQDIRQFLQARADAIKRRGIPLRRVALDPGFGFGKTPEQNYRLLRNLESLRVYGLPLLAGVSRKSMIGHITGRPASERIAGSVAGALAAVRYGAQIVRVHDVAQTVDALKVWDAVEHGV